jgi:hypothetical protein
VQPDVDEEAEHLKPESGEEAEVKQDSDEEGQKD